MWKNTNVNMRIGHMNRMDADIIPKSIFNNPPEGNGLKGRPKNLWGNYVQADLKKMENILS